MSKIQKALNALRQSQTKRGEDGVPADNRESVNAREAVQIRARNGSGRASQQPATREAYSFDKSDEITPRHKIDVPQKDLQLAGLCAPEGEDSSIGQQFRRIKRPIIQSAFEADLPVGDNANVIMMASALPGAGKSFCAFNLSQSISLERDIGALVVDADVLKPGISRSLGLQDHIGLIDYLVDPEVQLEDILVQTNHSDVIVVPSGKKHPEATELLASRRMQQFVSLLSRTFNSRAVIFDMPPLLLTSEAQVLAANAGQIVMVIEERVTSQESVIRALGMLDRDKPINAILNKSRSDSGDGYHSSDYGYYPYTASASGDA